MNADLLKAILAMDSYNRGYNKGLDLGDGNDPIDLQIGEATVIGQSNVSGASDEVGASFYAISYQIGYGPDPEIIIAYRGTDEGWDVLSGWPGGLGGVTSQSLFAAEFYHSTITMQNPSGFTNVAFTGHSLGGGLAGLMAAIYGQKATIFANMPFETSANYIYDGLDSDFPHLMSTYYYNGAEPLQPNNSQITAYAVEGEVLELIRFLQSTDVIALNPGEVELGLTEWVGLHSQALHVSLLYAQIMDYTDWLHASIPFIETLYDNKLAKKLVLIIHLGCYQVSPIQPLMKGRWFLVIRASGRYSMMRMNSVKFWRILIIQRYLMVGENILHKSLSSMPESWH